MKKLNRIVDDQQLSHFYAALTGVEQWLSVDSLYFVVDNWKNSLVKIISQSKKIIILTDEPICREMALILSDSLRGATEYEIEMIQGCSPNEIQRISESDLDRTVFIDFISSSATLSQAQKIYIDTLNSLNLPIVAIVKPSGLRANESILSTTKGVVKAKYTVGCYVLPLSVTFQENCCFVGELLWESVQDMKLADMEIIDHWGQFKGVIPPIDRFSHKGTNGKALLIAGSKAMMGAAVLSAKSAIRTGIGRLTCHTPRDSAQVLHACVYDCVTSLDSHRDLFTEFPTLDSYDGIAVGPGLGQDEKSRHALFNLLTVATQRIILDADALNLLASHKDAYYLLNEKVILTPHYVEFDRLLGGKCENSFDRITKLCNFASRYKTNVLLKGAYSVLVTHDGYLSIFMAGTPSLAKAGAGDVLTGILLTLLSQGIALREAVGIALYLHSAAAKIVSMKYGQRGVCASDLPDALGEYWKQVEL